VIKRLICARLNPVIFLRNPLSFSTLLNIPYCRADNTRSIKP